MGAFLLAAEGTGLRPLYGHLNTGALRHFGKNAGACEFQKSPCFCLSFGNGLGESLPCVSTARVLLWQEASRTQEGLWGLQAQSSHVAVM